MSTLLVDRHTAIHVIQNTPFTIANIMEGATLEQIRALSATISHAILNAGVSIEAAAHLPATVISIDIHAGVSAEVVACLPATVMSVVINAGLAGKVVARLPTTVAIVVINPGVSGEATASLPATVGIVYIHAGVSIDTVARLPATVTQVVPGIGISSKVLAYLPATVTTAGIDVGVSGDTVASWPATVIHAIIAVGVPGDVVARLPATVTTVTLNENAPAAIVSRIPVTVTSILSLPSLAEKTREQLLAVPAGGHSRSILGQQVEMQCWHIISTLALRLPTLLHESPLQEEPEHSLLWFLVRAHQWSLIETLAPSITPALLKMTTKGADTPFALLMKYNPELLRRLLPKKPAVAAVIASVDSKKLESKESKAVPCLTDDTVRAYMRAPESKRPVSNKVTAPVLDVPQQAAMFLLHYTSQEPVVALFNEKKIKQAQAIINLIEAHLTQLSAKVSAGCDLKKGSEVINQRRLISLIGTPDGTNTTSEWHYVQELERQLHLLDRYHQELLRTREAFYKLVKDKHGEYPALCLVHEQWQTAQLDYKDALTDLDLLSQRIENKKIAQIRDKDKERIAGVVQEYPQVAEIRVRLDQIKDTLGLLTKIASTVHNKQPIASHLDMPLASRQGTEVPGLTETKKPPVREQKATPPAGKESRDEKFHRLKQKQLALKQKEHQQELLAQRRAAAEKDVKLAYPKATLFRAPKAKPLSPTSAPDAASQYVQRAVKAAQQQAPFFFAPLKHKKKRKDRPLLAENNQPVLEHEAPPTPTPLPPIPEHPEGVPLPDAVQQRLAAQTTTSVISGGEPIESPAP